MAFWMFVLGDGMSFEFLDVGGVLSGQFDGLDEGDSIGIYNGHRLSISYVAGDGIDVGLYSSAIPEPGSGLLLGLIVASSLICRRRGDSRDIG